MGIWVSTCLEVTSRSVKGWCVYYCTSGTLSLLESILVYREHIVSTMALDDSSGTNGDIGVHSTRWRDTETVCDSLLFFVRST